MNAAGVFFSIALAFPSGWYGCSRSGPEIPTGFSGTFDSTIQPQLTCNQLNCVLTASTSFRGYVITSSDPNSPCQSHSENSLKSSVHYTASVATTLWATVVTHHDSAGHHYGIVGPVIVRPAYQHIYIIGAGPGGLSAARYALSLGMNVTVWERGDNPPNQFYEKEIYTTYFTTFTTAYGSYKYNPMSSSSSKYDLISMVGGVQAVNGAVFSPGSAHDLAKSVGVSLASATHAQTITQNYVEYQPINVTNHASQVGLMQSCLPDIQCDLSYGAFQNPTVARRSIGYNLPENLTIEKKTVSKVNNTHVIFETNEILPLTNNDAVIVAAGALSSPQLLGKTSFWGWNHYYQALPTTEPFQNTTQTFTYPNSFTEINSLKLLTGDTLTITMDMIPTIREYHQVGTEYTLDPYYADRNYAQAWHFAGTVDHSDLRIQGTDRIYIGDASALKTPFNCHTSMPAAAAGVLAVDSLRGTLQTDPAVPTFHSAKTGEFMYLFLSGTGLIAIGVIVHGIPSFKNLHYVITPIGVVLVITGAVLASTHPYGRSTMNESGRSSHVILGWITVGWLILQTAAGVYLFASRKLYPELYDTLLRARKWHRRSGIALLIVLLFLISTAARRNKAPLTQYDPGPINEISIPIILLLAVGFAVALFGLYTYPAPKTHTQDVFKEKLLSA